MGELAGFFRESNPGRTVLFFAVALVAFEAFLIFGIVTDHFRETLSNGAMICLSCIGVG
ncbi:MAG: hypothetical protein ABIE42_05690 [Candidatus Eisenbacteria bacterium]